MNVREKKEGLLVFNLLLLFAVLCLVSCKKEREDRESFLILSFSTEYDSNYSGEKNNATRALEGVIPDTNNFILSVRELDGQSYYYGKYSARPEKIALDQGVYNISVFSAEFDKPNFSTPIYGDEHIVTVSNGENINVNFSCLQINSGVRLIFADSFKQKFKQGELRLESEDGYLDYDYNETRIAYFWPKILTIKLLVNNKLQHLMNRVLSKAEILTLNISASESGTDEGNISIKVDTTRTWVDDDYVFGEQNDGSTIARALSVSDLESTLGLQDVWIKGFIVGGDISTSKISLAPPFDSQTHLGIADKLTNLSRENCAAVELKSEKVRSSLNLVSNPNNLTKIIYIKGDVVAYFGAAGVKNVSEFELVEN